MCVYKSIFLLKKTVSFRKVWFSIPVFVGKVYFLFGYLSYYRKSVHHFNLKK